MKDNRFIKHYEIPEEYQRLGDEIFERDKVEEDPITFQEYVGMLKDVVNAIGAGEEFNKIRIVYGKADWDKIRRKTLEFENSKDESNHTLTVEDAMITYRFTALNILKKVLAYLDPKETGR